MVLRKVEELNLQCENPKVFVDLGVRFGMRCRRVEYISFGNGVLVGFFFFSACDPLEYFGE